MVAVVANGSRVRHAKITLMSCTPNSHVDECLPSGRASPILPAPCSLTFVGGWGDVRHASPGSKRRNYIEGIFGILADISQKVATETFAGGTTGYFLGWELLDRLVAPLRGRKTEVVLMFLRGHLSSCTQTFTVFSATAEPSKPQTDLTASRNNNSTKQRSTMSAIFWILANPPFLQTRTSCY